MLRLAFDFIITWRETRTRPNAYLYSSYFMNNGGGDAVAPGRGFVVAVQNQNIVPRLGVFLYMGGFADGCKEGEYTGTYQ